MAKCDAPIYIPSDAIRYSYGIGFNGTCQDKQRVQNYVNVLSQYEWDEINRVSLIRLHKTHFGLFDLEPLWRLNMVFNLCSEEEGLFWPILRYFMYDMEHMAESPHGLFYQIIRSCDEHLLYVLKPLKVSNWVEIYNIHVACEHVYANMLN